MALTEHELKVLNELEESLLHDDPRFVRSIVEPPANGYRNRRLFWGVVGFVCGLALMVVFFTQSLLVGLVGIAIMFSSSLVVARHSESSGLASWRKGPADQ
jgi:hypothetical protein